MGAEVMGVRTVRSEIERLLKQPELERARAIGDLTSEASEFKELRNQRGSKQQPLPPSAVAAGYRQLIPIALSTITPLSHHQLILLSTIRSFEPLHPLATAWAPSCAGAVDDTALMSKVLKKSQPPPLFSLRKYHLGSNFSRNRHRHR